MKKICLLISFLFILVTLTSCTLFDPHYNPDKINITATIFPQYDMAKSIIGENGNVIMLVSPGLDVHTYDPSVDDIIRTKKTDLFIYNGLDSEPWTQGIVSGLDENIVLDLSKNIELVEFHEGEEHEEEHEEEHSHKHTHDYDPHIWLSIKNAQIMLKDIYNKICEIDSNPTNQLYYEINYQDYLSKLINIEQEIETMVANAKYKKLYFGAPFAFAYFCHDYELTYASAYDTCSSEIDPSIDDIISLNRAIIAEEIPVVFVKELMSNINIAKIITQNSNAEIVLLHSAQNVTLSDFKKGITFIDIWNDYNIPALKKGLGHI